MRISELSRSLGVDTETIRYYERSGLLPAARRSANGYRMYASEHVERLAFIRHCRALDMSLADIRRLLQFIDKPGTDCSEIDRLVAAQLARVRARLRSMRALARQLDALRKRCSNPAMPLGCGIIGELVSAARGEACACHASQADRPP